MIFPQISEDRKVRAFSLSPSFIEQFRGRQPQWGPVGYFTYKRTYARSLPDGGTEEFWQTVQRVVEGCFNIQKIHCRQMGLPWKEEKAQNSAQDMFRRIWEFKFTPPGRGLWTMGTDLVHERGSACLQNCFAGETEILTADGTKPIGPQAGTIQTLLTRGGKWVDAPIRSFGVQRLWRLVLSRQGVKKTLFVTGDHRWFAKDRRQAHRDNGFVEFKTSELRPGVHHLQYVFGQGLKNVIPSPFGVAHGFTYGDGTCRGNRNAGFVSLIGEKDAALQPFFSLCPPHSRPDGVGFGALPNFFKERPSLRENKSYLLGWLMGYFSADGTVSGGQTVLSSSDRSNLEFVRDVCVVLGIGTYSIGEDDRISNLTGEPHKMHRLCLMRDTLRADFFLVPAHRANFLDNGGDDVLRRQWTVDSVEETDREEEVFCATVEGEGAFALDGNILTGNCAFVSSENLAEDFAAPFCFLMDMSMLGVGVGGDTKGAGKVKILPPKTTDQPFVVEDNREGWVELLRMVLHSFVGKRPYPTTIDYSGVRGRGEPIKTFGGVASGPKPLHAMVESVTRLLLPKGMSVSFDVPWDETRGIIGKVGVKIDGSGEAYKIGSAGIVDLFNMVGKCVVSGGVRRCLPKGTFVHTSKGLIPIEQINPGMRVKTSNGYGIVTDQVRQGIQSITRVSLQTGFLDCTAKHRVAVMTDTLGNYIWKRVKELNIGDRLVFVDSVGEGIKTRLPDFQYGQKNSTTCKDITIPTLDVSIAWFFGLFHGDGYNRLVDGGGEVVVAFGENEIDAVEKAEKVLRSFGISVSKTAPAQERCWKLRVKSKQLATYLDAFKKPGLEMHVPAFILRGLPEIRAAYVGGLSDADGCWRGRSSDIVVGIWPNFLREVQAVLASLGIPTRFRKHKDKQRELLGWRPIYKLCLVGEKARKGFEKTVAPHICKYVNHRKTARSPYDFGFPAEMVKSDSVRIYDKKGKALWSPASKQMTVSLFERLTGSIVRLVPVEVLGVEHGIYDTETYDLSVDSNEFVIQDGILVHNTAEIMFGEPDDEEFIALKKDKEALNSHRWACVVGNTMVDTSEGTVPISSLVDKSGTKIFLNGSFHDVLGVKMAGHEPVYLVTTFGGPKIRATGNHPMMTKRGWVRVDELKIGDRLRVTDNRGARFVTDKESEDYCHGYLLGALIGDGTFTKTTTTGTDIARVLTYVGDDGGDSLREYISEIFKFSTRSDFNGFSGPHGEGSKGYYFISAKAFTKMAASWGVIRGNKTITDQMESGSVNFVAGVASGLFDSDGSVQLDGRLCFETVDFVLLQRLQRMLLRLGILSRVQLCRNAGFRKFPGGVDRMCCEVYRLVLSGYGCSERFVGLCGIHHAPKLKTWGGIRKPKSIAENFSFRVVSVVPDGVEDVFDVCVPTAGAFSANGLWVHNSNNSVFAKVGMDYGPFMEGMTTNGEPGFIWLDNMRKFSRLADPPDHKDRRAGGCNPCSEQTLESYELCVGGNTPLQMQVGVGNIQDFVGTPIKVWNGDGWSTVSPRITGENRELFRVTLSDGSYLDCTSNHGWNVRPEGKRNFRRVETKDLLAGSQVVEFQIDAPIVGWGNPHAFETGLFVGDGFISRSREYAYPLVCICGEKAKLQDLDVRGVWYKPQILEGYTDPVNRLSLHGLLAMDEAEKLNDKARGLTVSVFAMDRSSVLEFVAGWIETDGTITNKGTQAEGYRIYGSEPKMRDLQLLLRRIGINHATIRKFADAGEETNFGVRNYALWYCQISSFECLDIPTRIKTLANIGTRTARNNAHPDEAFIDRARKQKIVSVEKLPGLHTTYCFDEPKNHMAVFGNALTYQCNLVETYPAHHDTYEDFQRTLKMAYLYAKTVTLVPTHDQRANAVMLRNRRIGCSMSGITQAIAKFGRREFFNWCDKGYAYVHELDKTYSDWLCVPQSIKTTSVKPSGTVSLLCGATPGIHYPHSEHYIRHIRVANTSPLVEAARRAGHEVHADVYADDTSVIAFPVEEKNFLKGKSQVTVWEQFMNAVDMQRHWADNQVSVTVTFRPDEAADLKTCLETFDDRLKGVSVLPLRDKDHGYAFPPYVAITREKYDDMTRKLRPIEMGTAVHEVDEKFCTNDKCELPGPKS